MYKWKCLHCKTVTSILISSIYVNAVVALMVLMIVVHYTYMTLIFLFGFADSDTTNNNSNNHGCNSTNLMCKQQQQLQNNLNITRRVRLTPDVVFVINNILCIHTYVFIYICNINKWCACVLNRYACGIYCIWINE